MKILFQGDSITDTGRSRENDELLGTGYPLLVASALAVEEPGKHHILNRGISGDGIVELYARIKTHIINLQPDVLSILIGVNDVWHELKNQSGVETEKFYKIYSMLINEVRICLPNVKVFILEPFILKGGATAPDWDYFHSEIKKHAEATRRIASEYNLTFIPLQKKFEEVAIPGKESYWLTDGVHPTIAGHELIKREWLKAFKLIEK